MLINLEVKASYKFSVIVNIMPQQRPVPTILIVGSGCKYFIFPGRSETGLLGPTLTILKPMYGDGGQ